MGDKDLIKIDGELYMFPVLELSIPRKDGFRSGNIWNSVRSSLTMSSQKVRIPLKGRPAC